MKKWKLILGLLAGTTGVGVLGGSLALHLWVKNNLTREALVQRLESELNCRAEVKSVDALIFSSPAHIVLTGVTVRERDDQVGRPLAERKAATGPAAFNAEQLELVVNWADLLHGKLHVSNLLITEVWLRDEVSAEGVSSLATILRTQKKARASTTSSPPVQPATSPAAPHQDKPANPPAVLLPIGITMDSLAVKGAVCSFLNRPARTRTKVNDMDFAITDLDIDTGNLKEHNQLHMKLSGRLGSTARVKVNDDYQEVTIADFTMDGAGVVNPLDAETGLFNPKATLDLLLKKGSTFGGFQTVGDATKGDKQVAAMKKMMGIDVSDVVIGGALAGDVAIRAKVQNGRLELLEDARLEFPDYAVTLRAGSWLDGSNDDHEFALQLLPNEALSKRITSGVGKQLGDGIGKTAQAVFNDGQGHFAIDLIATGRLSKPRIRLGGQAGSIQQLVEGVGGGLLKQLLNK